MQREAYRGRYQRRDSCVYRATVLAAYRGLLKHGTARPLREVAASGPCAAPGVGKDIPQVIGELARFRPDLFS
jgi:hypothetical protein